LFFGRFLFLFYLPFLLIFSRELFFEHRQTQHYDMKSEVPACCRSPLSVFLLPSFSNKPLVYLPPQTFARIPFPLRFCPSHDFPPSACMGRLLVSSSDDCWPLPAHASDAAPSSLDSLDVFCSSKVDETFLLAASG